MKAYISPESYSIRMVSDGPLLCLSGDNGKSTPSLHNDVCTDAEYSRRQNSGSPIWGNGK